MTERFGIFSPKRRMFEKLDFETYDKAVSFLITAGLAWVTGGKQDVDIKFRRGVSIKPTTQPEGK